MFFFGLRNCQKSFEVLSGVSDYLLVVMAGNLFESGERALSKNNDGSFGSLFVAAILAARSFHHFASV